MKIMPALGKCPRCGDQVMWVQTTSGKNMPVDPVPVPDERGEVAVAGNTGVILGPIDARARRAAGGKLYVNHFKRTCGKKQIRGGAATREYLRQVMDGLGKVKR